MQAALKSFWKGSQLKMQNAKSEQIFEVEGGIGFKFAKYAEKSMI
jgi:hypothetical protein